MEEITSWLVGYVPGLLWLWWILGKDTKEPEPLPFVFTTYALGAVAALVWMRIRAVIEASWDGAHAPMLDIFVVTAAGEEIAKLVAFLPAFLNEENDEPMDSVVYASAAALGFGSLENLLWIQVTGQPTVALERAFTSMLVHVSCTATLGYWLGLARSRGGRFRAWIAAAAAIAAIASHGLFDLLVSIGERSAPLALLGLLPVMLVALSLQIRHAQRG